jgi:plasmid stabilization system protein ParE
MPSEIIWSPTALDHRQAIYEYILPNNPAAAFDVYEEIECTAGLLQDNMQLTHPYCNSGYKESMTAKAATPKN